ncbi:MAG: hypothetical protein MJ066_03560 [Clostridia bacterium]|nr:hypothetical protein [Clostridia bacterium]
MKKLLLVLFVIVILFCFASCANEDVDVYGPYETKQEETSDNSETGNTETKQDSGNEGKTGGSGTIEMPIIKP